LDGPLQSGYAKYAIRKGLPGPNQRRLAIENEPHTVDDFNGEIKEGYGKGVKKLLWTGNAVVKVDDQKFVGKGNYHEHLAERAGKHYDFVVEGVAPGTKKFEVHISNGPVAGRYAFIQTDKGMIVNRMKDQGLIRPKPDFKLKQDQFLEELDSANPGNYIGEWKADGSMANVVIKNNRAIFRSHRETGSTYYDRLPGVEDLHNRRALLSNRILFPGPNQDGTVLKGELFHPEGAARVGGILNSAPDKAIAFQDTHGPVTFKVWDIEKLRGKDVSHLPYAQRRELYVNDCVSDIRRYNGLWEAVPAVSGDFVSFYNEIIHDPRGLPYAEGIVLKDGNSPSGEPWIKVKFRDTLDARIVDVVEGLGKLAGKAGALLVKGPGGRRGEVGIAAPEAVKEWIFKHKDELIGEWVEIDAQDLTDKSIRAGQFRRFHPSKSEAGLLMYAEVGNPDDPMASVYAMKMSNGWRPK
jgi:ATP-dependent DNA ligase